MWHEFGILNYSVLKFDVSFKTNSITCWGKYKWNIKDVNGAPKTGNLKSELKTLWKKTLSDEKKKKIRNNLFRDEKK